MSILFCLIAIPGRGQIAAWDFTGSGNYSTFSATTFDSKLLPGYQDITRGPGASLSTAGNSFRTQGFKDEVINTANTDYFQVTLSSITGYEISLSTIDANFDGTNSFSASPGVTSQFAYSLDGITFVLIGSPVQSTSLMMTQIDLSGIAALQDVMPGTTITIRYYASGQTTTGGWGFYSSFPGSNGLAIGGYVTPIGATTHNTDYFKSRQDGNWATADTWESSADNVTWHIASRSPTKGASAITILNTHTVTISNSVSLDQTIVGGALELQTGGKLNINDGAGDDMFISPNGALRITSANNYIASVMQSVGAIININAGGKITIGNGSSVIGSGYENFATSIMNVWNNGAIYEYNNNAAFEASGLTYFPNAGSNIPIFRVANVTGMPGGSALTLINGILEVNSSFAFTGSASKTFRNGIRGNATLTQNSTAGNFNITSSNAILDGTSLQIVLNNPLNLSSSTTIPVGAKVTITGGNVDNSSSSSLLTVDGLLDMTNQRITNTNGTVVLTGTYRTSHSGGFSGASSSIPSGNIILNPGSTIELYSLNDQDLNQRSDFANLIFSGGGIKTPGNSFDANGTITIKDNAILDCADHNIGGASTNLTMMDNSRLIAGNVLTQPTVEGIYNLAGGTIEFANNNATFQSIKTIGGNYNNIEVSGKSVKNSNGNINLNSGGSFTVTPTGNFTINDDAITGADGEQTLTIKSGGIFNCGNSLGFYGAPIGITSPSVKNDIENIFIEPGSTINYSRSAPPLSNGDQLITTIGPDDTVPYQNLMLSGNGYKTAPTGTLEIKGDLTKASAAIFVHNNATVLLDGSAEQTYASGTPQMVFYNLTNNNTIGLNINNDLSVYNQLSLGDNSKTNMNADITMLSDNNSTANVASIAESSVINYYAGRFIVERYIPNHSKAWQFLGVPTKGSTIKEAWMESNIADRNGNPGYGTLITSNRATWAADGFDLFSPGSTSMKTFDLVSDNWKGVTSTSNMIDNQNGYMLFVRGDRSTHYGDPTTTTIMRTRGKLYTPGSEAPLPVNVPPNSFQSVSNPYASAIDFNKIIALSPGISNAYYIWDPQLTTDPSVYGLGAYRTISGNVSVPSSGNYTDGNIPPIQSGQAFFVRNPTASALTVNFNESVKVNGSSNVFRVEDIEDTGAQLRINLFAIHESQPVLIDGVLTLFHESYSNKTDEFDALKFNNSGENIGILINNKIFAIERRNIAEANDTLFYNIDKMKSQTYRLELIGEGLGQYGMKAFLKDGYLSSMTQLKPAGSTIITFDINNDSGSKAKNRFSVILAPDGPLPVSFVSVNASEYYDDILVKWKVENENNLLQYEPERSIDGLHFRTIGIVASLNLSAASYNFTDHLPAEGYNYYRIRSHSNDQKIAYSKVVKVHYQNFIPAINVYPNPVRNGRIHLHFSNMPNGQYNFKLVNSSGQLMLSKVINYKEKPKQQLLQFNKQAPPGVYHLEIIKPDGTKIIVKVSK